MFSFVILSSYIIRKFVFWLTQNFTRPIESQHLQFPVHSSIVSPLMVLFLLALKWVLGWGWVLSCSTLFALFCFSLNFLFYDLDKCLVKPSSLPLLLLFFIINVWCLRGGLHILCILIPCESGSFSRHKIMRWYLYWCLCWSVGCQHFSVFIPYC